MKKLICVSALTALSVSFPLITSCDSGGSESDSTVINRGYDIDSLKNNLASPAVLPLTVAAGEDLNITLPADPVDELKAENLNIPVSSSGQIIIGNFRFNYERTSVDTRDQTSVNTDQAQIKRSSDHSVTEKDFADEFKALVENGDASANGSLRKALAIKNNSPTATLTEFTNAEVNTILNALRGRGYRTRINPDSQFFEFAIDQQYRLKSTSNNGLLLNSRRITGAIQEITLWQSVFFRGLEVQDINGNVTFTQPFYNLVFGDEIDTSSRTGTFSLQLDSLTEG